MIEYIEPDKYEATLENWRGACAEIWAFSLTLHRLVIRLSSTERDVDLFLVAGSCQHVTGPFGWKDCNITIDESDVELYSLNDSAAKFQLQFDGILSVVTATIREFDEVFA